MSDDFSLKLRLYIDRVPRKHWREPVKQWPVITSSPTALTGGVNWDEVRNAWNDWAESEATKMAEQPTQQRLVTLIDRAIDLYQTSQPIKGMLPAPFVIQSILQSCGLNVDLPSIKLAREIVIAARAQGLESGGLASVDRVDRGAAGVSYLVHSQYSKESLPVSAQELLDVMDYALLHTRQIQQDAQSRAEEEV